MAIFEADKTPTTDHSYQGYIYTETQKILKKKHI